MSTDCSSQPTAAPFMLFLLLRHVFWVAFCGWTEGDFHNCTPDYFVTLISHMGLIRYHFWVRYTLTIGYIYTWLYQTGESNLTVCIFMAALCPCCIMHFCSPPVQTHISDCYSADVSMPVCTDALSSHARAHRHAAVQRQVITALWWNIIIHSSAH